METHRTLDVAESTTVKELLLSHPETLLVFVDRDVPIVYAQGTVGEAAQACGLSAPALVDELRAAIVRKGQTRRKLRRRFGR